MIISIINNTHSFEVYLHPHNYSKIEKYLVLSDVHINDVH